MSNLFGLFIVLYLLLLVIHGSLYSNAMQRISQLKKTVNAKGVNRKNVQTQVNQKLEMIKWRRRIIWIIYIFLFILHLKLISNIEFPEDDFFTNAIYLFVSVSILLFILNWIFGARIIEKKIRFIETK
ncbi:hypothetical protein N8328_05900 [Crocinitomicaceae bacterium]|jgi:hypothetical protein|nr:hypothetical protein [Crocinitomicaceae bacterium]